MQGQTNVNLESCKSCDQITPIYLNSAFNLLNTSNSLTYLENYFEDLSFPTYIYDIENYRLPCHSHYVPLPLVKRKFNLECYVKVTSCETYIDFACNIDEILTGDDSIISTPYYRSPFLQLYIEEFAKKTGYVLNSIDFDEEDVYESLKDIWFGDLSNTHIPLSLICEHFETTRPEWHQFEATSIIGGVKHACLSIWEFSKGGQPSSIDIEAFLARWSLEIVDLAINFSISKLVMSFLKLLNDFIPITTLIKQALHLINISFNYLKEGAFKAFSPQVDTEDDQFIATSEMTDFLSLDKFTDDLPSVAAAMSSIAVLMAGGIVGIDVLKSNSKKTISEKLADAFASIAKGKNGIYAMLAMIKDFASYVKQTVFDFVMESQDNGIMKLVNLTKVKETEDCKKSEFYQILNYLLNPQNLLIIQQNKSRKLQLEFIYKILDEIIEMFATVIVDVDAGMRDYIRIKYNDIKKLRLAILRKPQYDQVRFTPFWINIVGHSGTGKSVATPLILDYLYEVLSRLPSEYEVPAKDQWYHSVNFSEKFLTNYNGHYCVAIDDFLQDKAPLGEVSSALSLINWVSAIPYQTNQAAVEDKGIPFTSKFIISTSNDFSMQRNEITQPEALIRRMNMCVVFKRDDNMKVGDAGLGGKKTKICLVNGFNMNQVIREFKDVFEMIEYMIHEYIKWYKHQQEVIKTRKADEDKVQEMLSRFEPTSSWKCNLRINPTIKKMVRTDSVPMICEYFDCDCQYHVDMNNKYEEYVSTLTCYANVMNLEKFSSYQDPITTKYIDIAKDLIARCTNICSKLFESTISKIIFGGLAGFLLYLSIPKNRAITEDCDVELESTKVQYQISKPVRAPPVKAFVATSGADIEPMLSNEVSKQTYDLVYQQFVRRGAMCQIQANINNQTHSNCALRIGGTVILTNHHFMSYLNLNDKFTVLISTTSGNQRIEQLFNPDNLYRIPNQDLVLYVCDRSLPQSRNIIKHFPEDQVLATYQDSLIVTAKPLHVITSNVLAQPAVLTKTSNYEQNGEVYHVIDSYVTNCSVTQGMSGSALIGTSSKLKHKILGIQTCRNTKTCKGYFKPICQKQIQNGLDVLQVEMFDIEDDLVEACSLIIDEKCPSSLGKCNLIYQGTLPKTKCVKSQCKTKIQKSLIHDDSKVTQEPSVLVETDERMDDEVYGLNVLYRAIQGFDDPIGSVDTRTLTHAVNDLKEDYNVSLDTHNIPRRLLDDNEIINGVPSVINRINMQSSPGYPYVLNRKETNKGGKYEWFNEEQPLPGYGKTYSMKSNLLRGLEQREKDMKSGIKPTTIAYTCLKDETRPVDKIRKGKTRAFVCLPLDFNLLIRKYFGAFVASLHQQAGIVTACVGIDPATQWKDLYYKLCSKNDMWEDFDYANWDQHLHPEFAFAVASIVNYWYGDADSSENGKIRHMLIYDLVFTNVIVKNKMFTKSSGQCSGCAITAELNCVVHDILMYYVWLKMNSDRNYNTTLNEYRNSVASIMYGDDIVKSVVIEHSNFFNGTNIKPYMDELGMNITPGDKISTTFSEKTPDQILFLKRAFIKDGEDVKAPLRSDIVENIIQWIHASDDPIKATLENCQTALMESYMHGEKYFTQLKSEINNRIKNANLLKPGLRMPAISLDYKYLDSKYHDQTFICTNPQQDDFVYMNLGLW